VTGLQTRTKYTYDSFGNTTNSSGNVTNPFRYTGRDFDSKTSLYYYRARYYDTTSGRFISEDPMQFGAGVDFYAYVANSPVNFTDPSGLCKKHPCAFSGSAPPPGFYADLGKSDLGNQFNLWGFHHGGFLDAQAYGGRRNQAYANYVFGVYMASEGYTLLQTLDNADLYAASPSVNSTFPFFHRRYSSKLPPDYFDRKYRHTPAANIINITAGFNDARNGTLCTIN
jgi:RHS repeat-associated protein